MIHVSISEEIAKACPDLHVAVVECDVVNTVSDEQLWKEITEMETHIRTTCKLEDINKFPPIQATRQAYKRLGKDPNRYRPSAEALRRRILRELPLYRIKPPSRSIAIIREALVLRPAMKNEPRST